MLKYFAIKRGLGSPQTPLYLRPCIWIVSSFNLVSTFVSAPILCPTISFFGFWQYTIQVNISIYWLVANVYQLVAPKLELLVSVDLDKLMRYSHNLETAYLY
jgi:hypothetical protein